MFVPFDRSVRVNLGVVTLGVPDRLHGCVEALVAHESRHDFTVGVVMNVDSPDGTGPSAGLRSGVALDVMPGNLGWSGGLHRARALTDAELFVWVQDDMLPEPGWLDALVDAADAHPEAGAFGSVRVDADGAVLRYNAGTARPADRVREWSSTDRTEESLPTGVTAYDWVTSKGLLTRTSVFDEVSGPDPRLFPLNHVDKDYVTHLRCHGYDAVLVPGARITHAQSQSSSPAMRAFLAEWREPLFDARWAGPVRALEGRTSARVDHVCGDWSDTVSDPLVMTVGLEASRMLVPFMREREQAFAELHESAAEVHAAAQAAVADATAAHAGAVAEAELLRVQVKRLRRRLRRARRRRSPIRALARRLRR